jgi:hypothetical protein
LAIVPILLLDEKLTVPRHKSILDVRKAVAEQTA